MSTSPSVPSFPCKPTGLDEVASCNQARVPSTDHYGIANLAVVGVADVAFGVNDTVRVQATYESVFFVVYAPVGG